MAKKKFKDVNTTKKDADISVEEKLQKLLDTNNKDVKEIETLLREKIQEDKLYSEIMYALRFVNFTKHLYTSSDEFTVFEIVDAKMFQFKQRGISTVNLTYR